MLTGEHRLAALADADLFVLASRSENFGMAPAEVVAGGPPGFIFHADAAGTHVITVSNDLFKKLTLTGKDLDDFSLDTVKMF